MNMKYRVGVKHLLSIWGACMSLSWEGNEFNTGLLREGTEGLAWASNQWTSASWRSAALQSQHRADSQAVGSTFRVERYPEEDW